MTRGALLLKVFVLVAIVMTLSAFALRGDVVSATYKENKWCLMCHKSRNEQIVTAWQKTGHANSFWKVGQEKEGQRIVGEFGPNAPFGKDKIAYVMGAGIRRQAYLDADMKVLPAEWQVEQKSWKAIPQAEAATECLGCHVTGYAPAGKTWVDAGVGCQMCHGPGSEHMASSDKKGTIVRPQTLEAHLRADICGQCHSVGRDSTGKYAFPSGFRPSQPLASRFVDAKPSLHAPQQQYSELVQSAHWGAGTVCDTCHDPHGASAVPAQLRKSVNELCLGCHQGKITGAQHSPENLAKENCAQCHMPEGSHFFRKPQP